MITVSIKRDQNGTIRAFSVNGHSGYAKHGQDIVCAGVSAIVQTAILGLQDHLHIECAGSQNEGQLVCALPPLKPGQRQQADIVLETMLLGLTAIASSYADFVRILNSKEV